MFVYLSLALVSWATAFLSYADSDSKALKVVWTIAAVCYTVCFVGKLLGFE